MGVTVVCETLYATWALYALVLESNVPKSRPESVNAFNLASEERGAARVTLTV